MASTTAKTIHEYNNLQDGENKKICETLQNEIDKELNEAESKIWHGGPVWFLDGNPVVGYWVRKSGVLQLLFWSGQTFEEPGLKNDGNFKAAQKNYLNSNEINLDELNKWLKKSREIQWNYKNIVKNKGLKRLK
jgi:hypothetical protein